MYASVALPHWYDDRLEFPEKMLIYRTFRPVIVLIITNLSDTLHTLVINLSFFLLPRRTLVCMYWYRMWGGNMWRWDLSDTKLYNPSLELQFVTGATYNSSPELHPSTGDTPDHWSYSPSLELHPIIVVDTPDHWSCCTEQHITGSTPHHWSYNSSMELHPFTGETSTVITGVTTYH